MLRQSPPDLDSLLSLAKFGMKNRRMRRDIYSQDLKVQDIIDVMTLSVRAFLGRWFENEKVMAPWINNGLIGAFAGPTTPGTAYILLHHSLGGGVGSWGFVKGGMGGISVALQKSAERYGAIVKTNCGVESIIVENGVAKGVVTLDGTPIRSKIVVSNADPKTTFQRLMDETGLPEDFQRRVQNWRTTGASFKLNLLLNGLPEYTAYPSQGIGPGPQHTGSTYFCEDTKYMDRAFADANIDGRPSQNPIISLTIPSTVDSTLAPQGLHVAGCFIHYAPLELNGTTWEHEKSEFINRSIDRMGLYAPNMRDIIVAVQGISPLDLQEIYSQIGGSIFQGDMDLAQLFSSRFAYETPIVNLYLCGSGTHPGGGVSGLSGLNAVREILRH